MINESQVIVAKYLYDPFGNTLSQYGLFADANAYRFSSKEWNGNSGIYYYLYRFYDPNLQRWPNRDPISNMGFVNLQLSSRDRQGVTAHGTRSPSRVATPYNFVLNNPHEYRDALGLAPVGTPAPPPPPVTTGPGGGGDPCVYWAQQAMAAAAYLTIDPYNINQIIKLDEAVANFKALDCDDNLLGPPSEPDTCPKRPRWKPVWLPKGPPPIPFPPLIIMPIFEDPTIPLEA
jgi:RHS repeat-associated protein